MKPISIITINYNGKEGLQKTINSVAAQSFQDFEYIVIDGGSTDDSISVIQKSKRIDSWVSEPDNGIYDAQNKGINRAIGRYLLFLNSGDCLADADVLKKVSVQLESKKSFYYGNLKLEINGMIETHIAPDTVDLDFMLNSTFWHPCVFISAALFRDFGLYKTTFKIAGDYEFFVRCWVKANMSYEKLNFFVSLFDGNGISNNQAFESLQNIERELAWTLNCSSEIYQALKAQNSFKRSNYARFINLLQRFRKKQEF